MDHLIELISPTHYLLTEEGHISYCGKNITLEDGRDFKLQDEILYVVKKDDNVFCDVRGIIYVIDGKSKIIYKYTPRGEGYFILQTSGPLVQLVYSKFTEIIYPYKKTIMKSPDLFFENKHGKVFFDEGVIKIFTVREFIFHTKKECITSVDLSPNYVVFSSGKEIILIHLLSGKKKKYICDLLQDLKPNNSYEFLNINPGVKISYDEKSIRFKIPDIGIEKIDFISDTFEFVELNQKINPNSEWDAVFV